MRPIKLFLILFMFLCIGAKQTAVAQQKEDVIYLADGSQKKGKIVSISDELIKFSYTGEAVLYELKKDKISKIVFANGREEIFGQNSSTEKSSNKAEERSVGNLLAVIPFEIASNDQSIMTDVMRKKIQEACVEAMQGQKLAVQFQDPRTTNAILSKNGINFSEIDKHTPDELAKLLQVDYVVMGVYDIENKGASTYGSSSSSYGNKQNGDKEKGSSVTTNNSYTTTNYNTKVHMTIYDGTGRQLFSDSKSPLFGTLDSYKGALKTLAKKVPLTK
ncbi:MAG: hypothetical protein LBV59_10290 [Sphingobacterium sp.]|jgi:hypothetical protein|uniref:hypothetical protein n=1 Tax=Sphingobacterium sp. TaxID=341027 RepID=UPI002846A24B|nr:hypothetical protein [Sphingobacterium sp.]MDR3008313.1 hypothetical protein [Sphingobacterium sp.]